MIQRAEGHLSAAGAVYAAAWQASHRDVVRAETLARYTPAYGARYLQGLADKGCQIYVLNGPLPQGVLALDPERRRVELLYVAPAHWGRGVGSRLLAFALHTLGPGTVTLTVLNQNSRARRFYEARGFACTGEETVLSAQRGLSELTYRHEGVAP